MSLRWKPLKGEILAEGRGWRLVRENAASTIVEVFPWRPALERVAIGTLTAVLLVVPIAALAWTGGQPALWFGFFIAFVLGRPAFWWLRGRERLAVRQRFVSLERRSPTHHTSETVERPLTGDLRIVAPEQRARIMPSTAALAFHGGGRELHFGWGLCHAEASALRDALLEHAPICSEGLWQPGHPGVPVKVVARHAADDWNEPVMGYRTTRRMRVQTKLPAVVVSVAAAIGVVIAGLWSIQHFRDPGWAHVIAVVSFLVLLWCHPRGVGVRVRRSRIRRRAAAHDGKPWLWTGHFGSTRERRSAFHRLATEPATYLLAASALYLVIRPSGELAGYWPMAVAISLLGGVRVWNVAFAGESEIRWKRLDTSPGERLTAHFAVGRDGAHFESVVFRLRRFVERTGMVLAGVGDVICTHEGRYLLPGDTPPPGPGEEVTVHFDLPSDLPVTDLLGDVVSWWELDVVGQTSSGLYSEHFPAPICVARGGDADALHDQRPDDARRRIDAYSSG